jgi:hypothetical protein
MLAGIDQFVSPADGGVRVMSACRPVQPWLCGEALIGGSLWALWMDGALDLTVHNGSTVRVRRRERIAYPASSLEHQLANALADRPELAVDLLARAMSFTGARPWLDVIEVVVDENGTAHPALPAVGQPLSAEIRPRWLTTAVAELSERWDTWWGNDAEALIAVGRACHDAIRIRRHDHAVLVVDGAPVFATSSPDPAEADAELFRPNCPRWARRI